VRVNNSGNLSVKYFQSYFYLVMNTQGMNHKEARNLIFQRFFHQDPMLRGKTTYINFEKAYKSFEF
jgi:hypothetical protein